MASSLLGCVYLPFHYLLNIPGSMMYGNWNKLLSNTPPSTPPKKSPEEALIRLQTLVDMFERHADGLRESQETEAEKVKVSLAKKNMARARRRLARVKSLKASEERIEGMISTLTENMDKVQTNQFLLLMIGVNTETKEALTGQLQHQSAATVKHVMDEINDKMQESEEIADELKKPIDPSQFANALMCDTPEDILKELKELGIGEEEEEGIEEGSSNPRPESNASKKQQQNNPRIPQSMPTPPTKNPSASSTSIPTSRAKKTTLNDELSALMDN